MARASGHPEKKARRALPPRQRILDALILIVSISIVGIGALTIALICLVSSASHLISAIPFIWQAWVRFLPRTPATLPRFGGRLSLGVGGTIALSSAAD